MDEKGKAFFVQHSRLAMSCHEIMKLLREQRNTNLTPIYYGFTGRQGGGLKKISDFPGLIQGIDSKL